MSFDLYENQIADGPLALDGLELTGVVVDDTYEFVASHVLDDVDDFEVDGSGYAPLTGTARCELDEGPDGDRWVVWLDDVTTTDLSDVPATAGVVWMRASGALVGFGVDDGGGLAEFTQTFPSGMFDYPVDGIDDVLAGFDARVTALETAAAPDHNDLDGRDAAEAHPASAIDVDGTPLDEVLAGLEGGGGGGSDDGPVPVVLFLDDVDAVGGDFTTVSLYGNPGASAVPRSALVGVTALVVAGDSLGRWTITASGPCTPGPELAVYQSFVNVVGQVAATVASDGESVSGIYVLAFAGDVAAVAGDVAAVAADVAAVAADVADLTELEGDVEDLVVDVEARTGAIDVLAYAATLTPPIRYARCGGDYTDWWSNTDLLATPTTSLRIRSLVRVMVGNGEQQWMETASEPMDSGGVHGAGGDHDRFEDALVDPPGRVDDYFEMSREGDALEWHRMGSGRPLPQVAGLVPYVWIWREKFIDLATGKVSFRVRSDALWDYEDPVDGTRWRTTKVYDTEPDFTFADSASDTVEWWVGRGNGEFHVARMQAWVDGTLAADFDPSTVAAGATTIPDGVLSADWEADGDAVVVDEVAADAVAAKVHAAPAKSVPVDADELLLVDSEADDVAKKLTVGQLRAALGIGTRVYVPGTLYEKTCVKGGSRSVAPGSVMFYEIDHEADVLIDGLAIDISTGGGAGAEGHLYIVSADPSTGRPSTSSTVLAVAANVLTATAIKLIEDLAAPYTARLGVPVFAAFHSIVGSPALRSVSASCQFGPPVRVPTVSSGNGYSCINATGAGTSSTPLDDLSGVTFQADINQAPIISWRAG